MRRQKSVADRRSAAGDDVLGAICTQCHGYTTADQNSRSADANCSFTSAATAARRPSSVTAARSSPTMALALGDGRVQLRRRSPPLLSARLLRRIPILGRRSRRRRVSLALRILLGSALVGRCASLSVTSPLPLFLILPLPTGSPISHLCPCSLLRHHARPPPPPCHVLSLFFSRLPSSANTNE